MGEFDEEEEPSNSSQPQPDSNTRTGDVGHGFGWAGLAHKNAVGPTSYGFLQSADGLHTLMNKKSGGGYIGLRVDNGDVVRVDDPGNMWVKGDVTAVNMVVQGSMTTCNMKLGDVGHGEAWGGMCHKNAVGPTSYGFLQCTGGTHTLINKKSGGGFIGLRVDNADVVKVDDPGNMWVKGDVTAGNMVVQGSMTTCNMKLGDVGHGEAWGGMCHKNAVGPTSYGFLQYTDGTHTLINKKSGGGFIGLRVDNADVVKVDDAGDLWVKGKIHCDMIADMQRRIEALEDCLEGKPGPSGLADLQNRVAQLEAQNSKKSTLSLQEMVDTLQRDLDLHGNMNDMVVQACEMLGVPSSGRSLVQRARQCYEMVRGTGDEST